MSKTESLQAIQSIVGSALYTVDDKQEKGSPPLGRSLVTISRQMGANGGATAELLSQRLGVGLYDKALLKGIVKQAKGDKHLLERLDERATSLVDNLVHAFFSKKSTNKDAFFRYMAKVILNIGPSGGVLVGRGAHLLLPKGRVFRVRLEGSLKVCTKRVAKNRNIKKTKAAKLVEKTNRDRDRFVKEVSKRYPACDNSHDLVLNSDTFSPEQMVRIIVTGMTEMGFDVPSEKEAAKGSVKAASKTTGSTAKKNDAKTSTKSTGTTLGKADDK